MQMKVNKKYILVCLLICTLFLTSYSSVFNAGGNISPEMNAFTGYSLSDGSSQSSMNGRANSGHLGYLANFATLSSLFSMKQSRELITKTGSNSVPVIIAALIIFLSYSSSLLQKTCTPLNSIQLTIFLHKKDGMK